MMPLWKVAREAQRIKEQLKTLLAQPVYFMRQRCYDKGKAFQVNVQSGFLPISENVVVLLVYQPKGISKSIFHTLDNVRSNGFSTLVVLNSYVNNTDRTQLLKRCSVLMQRPNFGYDFGGYRDAILYLNEQQHSLNSITCINDSIWFPVFKNNDHLKRMAAIQGNFIGYSFSKGNKRKKNAHIQSYMFMFKGKKFLKSKDFKNYWLNLRISNSRYFTIRNSEMKMTAYFESKGYEIGWLFSADNIKDYYKNCPDSKVISLVKYLKDIEHHSASLFNDTSKTDIMTTREILISGLDSGKISRNVIGGEPSMLFQGIHFAAMKKSKSYNYQIQRKIAVEHGIIENFDRTVAAEILALNQEFTD